MSRIRTTGALAAAALALAGCGAAVTPPADKAQLARAVSVVRVELRPISGGIQTSGVLSPRSQVEVSPDLAGYKVSKLFVEEGDEVRAGQPLASMDGSILEAQYQQQAALAAEQKATAEQRQSESARVAGLDNKGVLSEEAIQDRRFAATSALAAANAQAASANEMQTRLQHMVLRAPVSGLIIQRNVNLGDISGGGSTPWFVMAANGEIELFADVAEVDFDEVRPGMRARVTLADDTTVDGVVRLVSPRVDTTTRLGRVRIGLPVRPDVRAGGYARAVFVDLSRAVPAAPESAIRYDANGASVMVVGPDDRVREQPVRTGQHGGGYVELLYGPPPGAVLVAKAAAQLLPGDYVKPDWSVGPSGP